MNHVYGAGRDLERTITTHLWGNSTTDPPHQSGQLMCYKTGQFYLLPTDRIANSRPGRLRGRCAMRRSKEAR